MVLMLVPAHSTLFRGNTILTKIMELCMNWYGKAFLEASIGPVIRRLISEKVAIEVDPMRTTKGLKDVEKNVEQLIYWCHEFWKQIYSVREECPPYVLLWHYITRYLITVQRNATPFLYHPGAHRTTFCWKQSLSRERRSEMAGCLCILLFTLHRSGNTASTSISAISGYDFTRSACTDH